ncbi:uncharacterized protein LOC129248993 [Anastrepha obliqua]|uniref:uncharacterized protein LOC129248993 n=1 Tax=Anastrepha obliqua TaxID=95512 RepID=UPI0024091C4B|nr:uncharacterized protein LOC129248993 [Anastrepha obliqua]
MQKAVKEYWFVRKNPNHQQQKIKPFSNPCKRYHVDTYLTIPIQQQQRAVLLIALILLQHVDLYMSHHIPANKRTSQNNDSSRDDAHYLRNRAHANGDSIGYTTAESDIAENINHRDTRSSEVGMKKRRIESGQPEEIFSFDDRIEANYDEYPMVVPKRAALLLDRLMVALHHALEQERSKISDFYAERNDKYVNSKEGNAPSSDDETEQVSANHMYSDDDPSVMMDYDFKDLNSINRATGETLMAKSFQRRGGMSSELGSGLGNAEGVAMLTAAARTDANAGGLGGGVGRSGIGNGGRMYWRCYFNAVSCF